MKQYLDIAQEILDTGIDKPNRTGIPTRNIFGKSMRFNMDDGFPIVTTKRVPFRVVAAELIWFLRGSRDVKELQAMGCHIWDANAEADYWKPKAEFEGDLGRVYGVQWRSWQKPDGTTVDQLAQAVDKIKNNPNDRRIIVTAWNPGELDKMALPPCHMFFQFFVAEGRLSLSMYQRSCDFFLGVPFNIASYSLLLHMMAQVTGLKPGEFVHFLGDTHLYENHIEQMKEQLTRKPYPLPKLVLNPDVKNLEDFTLDDIALEGYEHHPKLTAKMAV